MAHTDKDSLTKAIEAVEKEYKEAKYRQRRFARRPSGCMRGLQIALDQMKRILQEVV